MLSTILAKVRRAAKACTAAVVAGVPVAVLALQESSPDGSSVSVGEWALIAGAVIAAFGAVYRVPNAPPAA